MKLADMVARLGERFDQAISLALATEAKALFAALGETLDTQPGGPHSHPWRQTGALHDSIALELTDSVALIGSNDPVALYQEHGSAKLPPRPSFGPLAAVAAPGIAHRIGEAAHAALRGEN